MKIFVLETSGLHLGYLGTYGNEWVATPNLDRLASQGIVFDQHYVDRPEPVWPFRSDRSSLTGFLRLGAAVPPSAPSLCDLHPVRRFSCPELESFSASVVSHLDAVGPDEVCWVEGPMLGPPWNLSDDLLTSYFEDDEEEEDEGEPWPDPPLGPVEKGFDLPRLQNTYAGVMTAFDAHLGRILDHLEAKGHFQSALFCLIGSAGLPLAEHGQVGGESVHEEIVHVPMIWRLPMGADGGLRIEALTQPVDLLPSFFEFLRLSAPTRHGFSLWPLLRGEVDAVRPYILSASPQEWLLRTLDAAFILPREADQPRRLTSSRKIAGKSTTII